MKIFLRLLAALMAIVFLVFSAQNAQAVPPAGATAQCNDGTFSFSKNHSGTCSQHGGVSRWLDGNSVYTDPFYDACQSTKAAQDYIDGLPRGKPIVISPQWKASGTVPMSLINVYIEAATVAAMARGAISGTTVFESFFEMEQYWRAKYEVAFAVNSGNPKKIKAALNEYELKVSVAERIRRDRVLANADNICQSLGVKTRFR